MMRTSVVVAGAASQGSIDLAIVLLCIVLALVLILAVALPRTRVSEEVASSLRTSADELKGLIGKGQSAIIRRLADVAGPHGG